MNIPLLRRIQRQIDKAPSRLRMATIKCELEWPKQFQGLDDGSEEAASRAIKRIDHWIATEGRE